MFMMEVNLGFPEDARASRVNEAPRLRPFDGESILARLRTSIWKSVQEVSSHSVTSTAEEDLMECPREGANEADEGQFTELQGGNKFHRLRRHHLKLAPKANIVIA